MTLGADENRSVWFLFREYAGRQNTGVPYIYIYIYIYGVYGYKYGYKYIKHGNIFIWSIQYTPYLYGVYPMVWHFFLGISATLQVSTWDDEPAAQRILNHGS